MKGKLARWAAAPVHVAALATGAKSFLDNPVIGSTKLNESGLHVARMRLAHRLADRRRARLAGMVSREDAAAFERNGFVLKENFLPDFAQMEQEVLSLQAPARQMIQGDTMTRRIALDRSALARAPRVRAVLESPEWLGLIRYIGSSALQPIHYVQTIKSHVRNAPPDPQTNLHADTFHPTVKAWLFLTDVAEDEGPFVYVPGSHKLNPRRLAWERRKSITAAKSPDRLSARGSFRITPEELGRLGYGTPTAFAVKKNTLVVADTGGFHARGPSARPSTRIEIWAYGRRNPFLPWTGLDPAGFPFLRDRMVPLYWRALDFAERLNLKRNPWRDAGVVSPDSEARV